MSSEQGRCQIRLAGYLSGGPCGAALRTILHLDRPPRHPETACWVCWAPDVWARRRNLTISTKRGVASSAGQAEGYPACWCYRGHGPPAAPLPCDLMGGYGSRASVRVLAVLIANWAAVLVRSTSSSSLSVLRMGLEDERPWPAHRVHGALLLLLCFFSFSVFPVAR